MPQIAQSSEILTKRLRRFFEKVPDERKSLLSFIKSLDGVSEIFIFGGLIREICLHGIENFKSDVDIVVCVKDRALFEKSLTVYNKKKNKFGGYRILVSKWFIDLWEFEKTWAFSKGLIKPIKYTSLLDTTFFNWDSAFYDFRSQKLYCKNNYFKNLSNKILDVNLKENPNQYGAFIRTLRLISNEHINTGKKLSEFIFKNLNSSENKEILEYEKNHFNHRYLDIRKLQQFRKKIDKWEGQEVFSWKTNKKSKKQLYLFN